MPLGANSSGTGSYFYPTMRSMRSTVDSVLNVQNLSSTFTTGSIGSSGAVVLGPISVGAYKDYTVTMINNSVNNLISGSVQVSVDGTNWTNTATSQFTNLTSSGVASASFVDRTDRYVRALAYPSGANGAVTGSINCYIVLN